MVCEMLINEGWIRRDIGVNGANNDGNIKQCVRNFESRVHKYRAKGFDKNCINNAHC